MDSVSVYSDRQIGSKVDSQMSCDIKKKQDQLPNKEVLGKSIIFAGPTSKKYTPNLLPTCIDNIVSSRKRGRPRKYPILPNNGKTFKCVPTASYLAMPIGFSAPPSVQTIIAKFVYHRSYVLDC